MRPNLRQRISANQRDALLLNADSRPNRKPCGLKGAALVRADTECRHGMSSGVAAELQRPSSAGGVHQIADQSRKQSCCV